MRVKELYMRILSVIFSFLILSCTIDTTSDNRSDEDIKLDLLQVTSIIPAIQAGMNLVDEESVLDLTRALDPTVLTDSDAVTISQYFGESWATAPYTPSEVYAAAGGTGAEVRIPASGYIKGLYEDNNNSNDFYMTMNPVSGKLYLLKLYIYPRDLFTIDHTYLEYYVDEDNTEGTWAWSWFDNKGSFGEYAKEITYYRDGTYSKRDSSPESDKVVYNEVVNNAPSLDDTISTVIGDSVKLSLYEYVESPYFTKSAIAEGNYSSYTNSLVKGSKTQVTVDEYYSEDSSKSYSLLYAVTKKRSDEVYSVTRYIKDRVNGITNIVALNTVGTWYTEFNRVYTTDTTYTSESHIWYAALSSSLDIRHATTIYNELTKNGDIYEGTMTQYWDIAGNVYNYSIDTTTGTISFSYLNSLTRGVGDNFTISLSDVSDKTVSGNNWSYKFSYENGVLYGTYTYKNFTKAVDIYLDSIDIGGKVYNWD